MFHQFAHNSLSFWLLVFPNPPHHLGDNACLGRHLAACNKPLLQADDCFVLSPAARASFQMRQTQLLFLSTQQPFRQGDQKIVPAFGAVHG
jgi:hypothetical protein